MIRRKNKGCPISLTVLPHKATTNYVQEKGRMKTGTCHLPPPLADPPASPANPARPGRNSGLHPLEFPHRTRYRDPARMPVPEFLLGLLQQLAEQGVVKVHYRHDEPPRRAALLRVSGHVNREVSLWRCLVVVARIAADQRGVRVVLGGAEPALELPPPVEELRSECGFANGLWSSRVRVEAQVALASAKSERSSEKGY